MEPIKIFISYAHKDEKLKNELLDHLSGLKRNRIISDWTDQEMLGGEKWDEQIVQNLDDSKIILFLVSPSFMSSNYINEKEIKLAIDKHENGEAIIVPIIIRFCDFKSLPLHEFQVLPTNAKPIEAWKPRNKGWLDVVIHLKKIIAHLDETLAVNILSTQYNNDNITLYRIDCIFYDINNYMNYPLDFEIYEDGYIFFTKKFEQGFFYPYAMPGSYKAIIFLTQTKRRLKSQALHFSIPVKPSSNMKAIEVRCDFKFYYHNGSNTVLKDQVFEVLPGLKEMSGFIPLRDKKI